MGWIGEAILGFILGGSFITFVQFLISRSDKKNDRFDGIVKSIGIIEKKIDDLDSRIEENEAVNKRVRILRFADEMHEEKRHSKDSFDQVLSDITGYNQYCTSHPEFRNNQTAVTVDYIKKCYAERLERHDFV